MNDLNKAKGIIYGLAIGDAFCTHGYTKKETMKGGSGEWEKE